VGGGAFGTQVKRIWTNILPLASALGVGFLLGYFVRAMISRWRRRRRSRQKRSPEEEMPLRLERPGSGPR